jgi:guanylate kinase
LRDCRSNGSRYYQDTTLAGILFIISAPSGSGKSTLVKHVRSLVDRLDFSVSYTTRARRGAEQPDKEYHYITPEKFLEMRENGEFLEWASVFGNYYGTAYQSLIDAQAQGKDLLLDIDVQGAAQIRGKMPDAVSIFVLPPTPEVLKMRLRDRSLAEGKLDEEEVTRRLAKARGEIDRYRQYDYIIVNDVLKEAVESLTAIVLSERARRQGTPPDPDAVRTMLLADKSRQANAVDRLYPVLASFGLIDVHATRA